MKPTFLTRLRRWIRRLLIVTAAVTILLAGGWRLFEYVANVDRYRPLLESELGKLTGLPVRVGEMDLQLIPVPRLAALSLEIGQGDFKLEAKSLRAYARLSQLLYRKVNLTSIRAQQATLTLPPDDKDFQDRLDTFIKHISGDGKSEEARNKDTNNSISVEVDEIQINQLTVQRGNEVFAVGALRGIQPFSGTPLVSIQANTPFLGTASQCAADLRFTSMPDAPTDLKGAISINGADIKSIISADWLPPLTGDFQATVEGKIPGAIQFDVQGDASLKSLPTPVNAAVGGIAWWQDGQLLINDISLDAAGLKAAADLAWTPNGESVIRIMAAECTGAPLAALLQMVSPETLTLAPREDARLQLSDWLIEVPRGDKPIRLAQGNAVFSGYDVVLPEGTRSFVNVQGKCRVNEGVVEVEDIRSEGIQLAGTVRPNAANAAIGLDIHGTILLSREQMAPWFPLSSVQELSGTVELAKLTGTFSAAAFPPSDLSVQARLKDVSATLNVPQLSAPLDVDHVSGGLAYEGGKIQVDRMTGQGITVQGTLLQEPGSGKIQLDLNGEADLSSPLLTLAIPAKTVKDLRGKVLVQRAAGTFVPGQGIPADLTLEGRIEQGSCGLVLPNRTEALNGITAQFFSAAESIDAEVKVQSATLGQAEWKGKYARQKRSITGTLWINLDEAAKTLLPAGEAQSYLSAIFRAYGSSGLDVNAVLPGPVAPGAAVEVRRQGEPALNVRTEFASGDKGLALSAVLCQADIPVEWLAQALPPRISAEGLAHFEMRRTANETGYTAELQLDPVAIMAGQYLRKKAGDRAAVRLTGGDAKNPWTPREIHVFVLNEDVVFKPQGQRWSAGDLDFDVAALIPLLPEGATAGGHIDGSVATNPVTAALQMQKVSIALAPELAIDSVEGILAYRDGYWTCQNLRMLGAGSDCSMTAGFRGPTWHVDVTGSKLNLNALTAMRDAFSAFQQDAAPPPESPEEESAKPAWSRAITGDITMDIKEVLFRRGALGDVKADIAFRPEKTVVDHLSMRLYEGSMKGSILLSHQDENAPGNMDIQMSMTDADLRILDEILFDETRAITGTISGNIALQFPYGHGAVPYNGLNGAVTFEAKKGSYGRMGFATKLLMLLKTTEIIRLRLPSLSDKGLTFTTSSGKLTMKEGIMTVDEFVLTDKAYALTAKGLVDFPNDSTQIEGRMYPLESVTGIVGRIPILGDTLNLLKKTTGLPIHATGSPFDPSIRMETAGKARKELKNSAEEAVKDLSKITDTASEAVSSIVP